MQAELRRRLARQRRIAAAVSALRAFHLDMASALACAFEAEGATQPAASVEAPCPSAPEGDLIDLSASELPGDEDLLSGLADSTQPKPAEVLPPADKTQEETPPVVCSQPPQQPAEEDPGEIEARLEEWRRGKNLRALLASLHELSDLAPDLWQRRTLADLVDPASAKAAFRQALLTFHPDKLPEMPLLARGVTDALVSASRNDR